MLAQPSRNAERNRTYPVSARTTTHRQPSLMMSICCFPLLLAAVVASSVTATEFRVESEVYIEDSLTAVRQTTTLFQDQLIVDFQHDGSGFVCVVDRTKNAVVLIDEQGKRYAQISADEAAKFAADQRALTKNIPGMAELLAPVERTWNERTQILTLANSHLTYNATLVRPAKLEFASAYRSFADWMARLNAMQTFGHPPAPRLELNREMADLSLVPSEVRKTTIGKSTRKARSTHRFYARWRSEDRQRFEQITDAWPDYQKVNRYEFFNER